MSNKTLSKTKKFVKQVAKKENAKAQRTLESIIKAKVAQRVKETLAETKENN